jgi:hypothetical protein
MVMKTRAKEISRPAQLRPKPPINPRVMPEKEPPPDLPDFTLLFLPIQNYLANAPHVTEEQLRAAIDAYNEIVTITFGREEAARACSEGHVVIINRSK